MTGTDALDWLAVHALYARYNWAVDTSDGDALAAVFTPDGAFVGSVGTIRGHDALRAFAVREDLGARGLQHWNSNIVIDFTTPDQATSRAYMLALVPADGAPIVERAGTYADILLKTAEGWRFSERRFTRQIAGASAMRRQA